LQSFEYSKFVLLTDGGIYLNIIY